MSPLVFLFFAPPDFCSLSLVNSVNGSTHRAEHRKSKATVALWSECRCVSRCKNNFKSFKYQTVIKQYQSLQFWHRMYLGFKRGNNLSYRGNSVTPEGNPSTRESNPFTWQGNPSTRESNPSTREGNLFYTQENSSSCKESPRCNCAVKANKVHKHQ